MTDRYYIELIKPILTGLIFSIIYFFIEEYLQLNHKEILNKILDITFIIFGFLLTVLTLFIQKDNEFKKSSIYIRLIDFNKRLVYVSLTLGIYSFIFMSLLNKTEYYCLTKYFFTLTIFMLAWLVFDSYTFIKIFYKLAKNSII